MSETTFIFGFSKTQLSTVSLDAVVALDADLSIEHTMGWDLTEHPVEYGSQISDHRIMKPREVRIEGVIANFPFEGFGVDLNLPTETPTKVANAWETLQQLANSAELIDISTPLANYTNMQIIELSAPQVPEDGDVLRFTVKCREVFLVKSDTISSDSAAAGVQNKGTVGKTPAPAAPAKSVNVHLGGPGQGG